jgi:hypothetical protein
MEWSTKIPEEQGQYWFIGYAWGKEHKKELYYVSVRKILNGFVYITSGNFMENKQGFWQKVILPELPEGTIIR